MKKLTKILVMLLVSCQIALCFTACKKEEQTQPDVTEEKTFDLTRELLPEYKIVVPNKQKSDMSSAANTLQGAIEKLTGAKPEIKVDTVIEGSDTQCETEYEILLGYADRDAAYDAHAEVKENDTGYALVDKKIVIFGYSSATAVKSVSQFKLDILDNAPESGVMMKSGEKKINLLTASKYDTLTVNGVDITKYKLVYPQSSVKGENKIATYLQEYIRYETGYVVRCVSDATEAYEYEIQIGDTARVTDGMRSARTEAGFSNGKAYIGKTENGLWLSGNGGSIMYNALTKLIGLMAESEKTLKIDLSEDVCEAAKELEISVMTYNVYFDLSDDVRDPDGVMTSINTKDPDIFGLNEAGADWIDLVNANAEIKSEYSCVKGKPADNEVGASYNPIFYKKDKFEVLSSGTKWLSATPDSTSKFPDAKHYKILTYAIFKDKATKTEFMYINVHLDGSNDEEAHASLMDVRKKQAAVLKDFAAKYNFLPIIIGGDFNEKPTNALITGISSGTRIVYGGNVASEKTELPTVVNGEFTALVGNTIDYIFVTSDSVSVEKYETWDNKTDGKYPSDHIPVYAELTVKY